ncbi:MAG TPA: class I SAM-dependent methyltransferase [Candidatus Dormibacteraeota bacterium]|nr:class I SAM-dependent methyltransferase [Candidatus Dormibacteraeota bacterium]
MTRQPGLPAYDDERKFPALVWRAVELTRRNEFPLACTPEVGRLLQLLAAGAWRLCELGTAYGVGSAWLASGMRSGATLLTVEKDLDRAGAARELFRGVPTIEAVAGDWSVALARGPFDLLFSDGGPKREPGDPEKLLPLLRARGLVVLDDYTPGIENDVARQIWFENPAYRAIEITLTPESAVILARRR